MTFFDEQPDGDPHGECAAEIHRLTVELTALSLERSMRQMADESNRELRAVNRALQAQIDALMLEYCPDEMTPEQLATWAAHQKPVSDEEVFATSN